ncbi:type II toxin-antitoxin system VapC family toxin [Phormidesmis priestleyi ULC007]|uniref:Type II toxin-antitoxin system VapC family toxin n=1 Tax=Phormidesmis priestleyi ULC007 TaxID=1920490 RepID=A0A2T1DG68_9CYAN|nr:type II toxin-antitoxin system VapC family toxin [Phormidesmis priestleyi]PSB19476.1 type II toxin-antitoxin system VapC family toxin [Phormidesmis priestleyi ULC007]PZO53084.1 MAG: type II toxin-antitoxin system VapC family toxin [Phormidesmis priestleyi]
MTLWILDTDHVSLWQQGHSQVSQQIAERGMGSIAMTVITAEEQLRGRLDVIRRAESGTMRVLAYARFRETLIFLGQSLRLLEFSAEADIGFAKLKQQRIRIGAQDLRIAAIALAINGTVVTRNRRDFEKVPSLTIEDWTIERNS